MPKGVRWIREAAVDADPDTQTVTTERGHLIGYDYLVVAPGIQLDFGKIPGLTETLGKNGVSSNYRFDLTPRTWEFIRDLRGGTAIFTMPAGPIKCAGAPQKIAYLAADWWRSQGVLDKTRIILVLPTAVMFSQPDWAKVLEGIAAGGGHQLVDPAVEVTAAERAALQRGEPLLTAGHPGIGSQAMLHEAERAAGPQHPADLGQGPHRVRDRAQRPGAQHIIDAGVADRQRLGVGTDVLDRYVARGGSFRSQLAARGGRVDGPDPFEPGRVVRDVQPRPEPDLQYLHADSPPPARRRFHEEGRESARAHPAVPAGLAMPGPAGQKRRSRRLLDTTNMELNAIAAAAMSGLRNPRAASGMAAVL